MKKGNAPWWWCWWKIHLYINVMGIITKFDTQDHSFNMCPTQYIALPPTTSPLPLHGYFMESKWWGDGKKPTLSLGSTIAFGGFIDRIWWECSIDKAMLSKSQISLTLPISWILKIHLAVNFFFECLLKILTSELHYRSWYLSNDILNMVELQQTKSKKKSESISH